MIQIHRPPVPDWVDRQWLADRQAAARAFFAAPEASRRQEKFAWEPSLEPAVPLAKMAELFNDKCAYCETHTAPEFAVIDRFRPRENAIDQAGNVDPDFYWWLAYEWDNLYYCCAHCARAKGSHFPVDGPRTQQYLLVFRREKALLVDPCRTPVLVRPAAKPGMLPTWEEVAAPPMEPEQLSHPAKHLRFDTFGTPLPSNTFHLRGLTPAGETTIRLLELNRPGLVQERRAITLALLSRSDFLDNLDERWPHGAVRLQVGAQRLLGDPYLLRAARERDDWTSRWVPRLQPYFDAVSLGKALPADLLSDFLEVGSAAVDAGLARGLSAEPPAREPSRRPRPRRAKPPAAPPAAYDVQTLRRIEIHNFRGIADLALEFDLGRASSQAPWLMLLGENGTGKSSVLVAVALALMSPSEREAIGCKDAGFALRHGTRSGSISLELSGGTTCKLAWRRGRGLEASVEHPQPQSDAPPSLAPMLLLGYGPTRLLPNAAHQPSPPGGWHHVRHLFDAYLPVVDANGWLAAAKKPVFDYAARSLKEILDLEAASRFYRQSGKKQVQVSMHGTRMQLDQLSAGYQAMLGLVVDVISRIALHRQVVEAGEGLVLVDEIGLHLHPRWRMRVVGAMRRAFPRLQVLATTHEPLCLRGLHDGEVAVMRRDADDCVVALTKGLPPVDALRVDQLLTSEYFGLHTAMDPDLEAKLAVYYQLLAKRDRDADDEERLKALTSELEGKEILGNTPRERLMYEAIDRYVAEQTTAVAAGERAALPALKQQTLATLKQLWDEA